MPESTSAWFETCKIAGLSLKNRWVMGPMTRSWSPGGVPVESMIDYYARRARGGIGLIISEGVLVDAPYANAYGDVPEMTARTVEPWRRIVKAVRAEGTRMFAQLWHCGPEANPGIGAVEEKRSEEHVTRAVTAAERNQLLTAFVNSAVAARAAGFDGVELHAAHGYLLDSFLRSGEVGYVAEIIREIRRQIGPTCKICVRFSPWRVNDLAATYTATPRDLERVVLPLVEAGTDILHASVRRFWVSPFGDDDDLGLAGWTRNISGVPTITVGNVGLVTAEFAGTGPASLGELRRRYEAGYFDLVAVARPLITDADWVNKIRDGRIDAIAEFFPQAQAKIRD